VIHIAISGNDRILGRVISLPQVPRVGEFVRVSDVTYAVEKVTWYSESANPTYSVALQLATHFHNG